MLWILNGLAFRQNFSIHGKRNAPSFKAQPLKVPTFINTAKGWVKYNPGELAKIEIKQTRAESFSWSWPRKSWSETERHVFIDFGGEDLFWVKGGMGSNSGTGQNVPKETFIKKYGGNLELINILLERRTTSH
jgi:hypothetical protein